MNLHGFIAIEIGIVVVEGVETVGAGGDDLLHAIGFEGPEQCACQFNEQVLVTEATCRLAVATRFPQHSEVDLGVTQQFDHRKRGSWHGHQRSRRSHVIQVFVVRVRLHRWDVKPSAQSKRMLAPIPRDYEPASKDRAKFFGVLSSIIVRWRRIRIWA